MKKTTTSGSVFNGPVHVEVKADSPEKAKELARAVPGLTVSDAYEPIPMDGGTYIMSAEANDVTAVPDGIQLWAKSNHQMT
ncbi:MAG: hypothetical protein K2W95_14850 [Candidatus Obscuribacterales bacterium]|nr:hypothetical protein [Candidatus Obscuribacterales bacterium]